MAKSGGGKSTTCWALASHGCSYLSDELAPVELHSLEVLPYPHALNLKSEPSAPYILPDTTLRTDYTLHVPPADLPSGYELSARTLSTIFHLNHVSPETVPALEEISAGKSAALLYANALNPLCHEGDGLDAAVDIASRCRNFHVTSGALDKTAALILGNLDSP